MAFQIQLGGKQPRYSLGTYPAISLKDARVLRDQAKVLIARGVDPRIQRRQVKLATSEKMADTFERLANDWHDFKVPRLAEAKKGAAAQARFYLDKDLIPVLSKLPLADIKKSDVLSALRRIEKRGSLNSACKCRTWLNQIFRYGIAKGLVDVNPAADHIEKHISLDELFDIRAPHVYLVKIEGDSMQGAGIYCGDLVIVDRSLYAEHGDIVIAALNSEPVCKRLHIRGGRSS